MLDHVRTTKPPNYRSNNLSKWEFDNVLYQKHLALYLDKVFHYLSSTGARSVLDVGCGEGVVYRAMRQRGWRGEWTGFDYSAEAVSFARHASPEVKWQQASVYHIPFADKSFDLAFSSQVFEHLSHPLQPLRECERVARQWLLLSVPLEPFFRTLTWCSVKLKIGRDPGHVNFWAPADFRKFVGAAGRVSTWDWTTVYQLALVEIPHSRAGLDHHRAGPPSSVDKHSA